MPLHLLQSHTVFQFMYNTHLGLQKIVKICFQNKFFKNAKICSYFGHLLTVDRLHIDTAPGTRPNLHLIWGKQIQHGFLSVY